MVLIGVPTFAEPNPERNAYYGETHIHTSWSVDAWVMGNRVTGPADRLRAASYAKLSLGMLTIVVTLLGLHHDYLNGVGLGTSVVSAVALLGLAFPVFALVAVGAASVVPLRADWARIAVRAVGS